MDMILGSTHFLWRRGIFAGLIRFKWRNRTSQSKSRSTPKNTGSRLGLSSKGWLNLQQHCNRIFQFCRTCILCVLDLPLCMCACLLRWLDWICPALRESATAASWDKTNTSVVPLLECLVQDLWSFSCSSNLQYSREQGSLSCSHIILQVASYKSDSG